MKKREEAGEMGKYKAIPRYAAFEPLTKEHLSVLLYEQCESNPQDKFYDDCPLPDVDPAHKKEKEI